MGLDHILEKGFFQIGLKVGQNPLLFMLFSVIVTAALGYGFASMENETRPDKQWVPSGSKALIHKDYVDAQWPGAQRFSFWIATCKVDNTKFPKGSAEEAAEKAKCNLLEAKYLQRLFQLNERIMSVKVDGDAIVADMDKAHGTKGERPWTAWAGNWTFNKYHLYEDRHEDDQSKCFKFGPFCGKSSILDIFNDDKNIIGNMTDTDVLNAIEEYETQTTSCPLTLARQDSPCVSPQSWEPTASATDCKNYKTPLERCNCRIASIKYCQSVCPFGSRLDDCGDRGCLQIQQLQLRSGAQLNCSTVSSTGNNQGDAPTSAFEFVPTKVKTLASSGKDGPLRDANGKVKSASSLFGYYVLNSGEIVVNGEREDKVGEKWEMDALCILGIDANTRDDVECPGDDLLEFTPQFTRSLGDEFGTTIRSDGPSMGIAIMLIIGYLIINLSRFDHKYSMIAMSMAEVLAIGMSYAAAMGMSSYLNLPNNQLNLNIPFLLAGLGVDDAFVIGSEFQLNRLRHPDMDIPNLIALTAQTGGISILITSVTDALAFLVGSATVIPVLSWFCVNVGIGVIFCFIFQITIFLPALALNERRVLADRLDCLCCFKRGCLDILCCKNGKEWRNDHPTAPNGCCCCCFPKSCRVKPEVLDANLKRIEDAKTVGEREITLAEINNGTLGSLMKTYAEFITSKVGLIFTGLVFLALFAFGILGATRIYKDFKLEWFVPDGSYVNVFFKYNNEYYASGSPCSLYVYDTNMFKEQKGFHQLKKYMNSSKYFDQDSGVTDWYAKFQESATGMNATAMGGIDTSVDGEPIYENESLFYTNLHDWLTSAAGGRYRNNIHWNDAPCDESNQTAVTCDPTKGIKEARWQATLSLAETSTGDKRYETMTSVRAEMKKMFPTASAFPYSYK
eukprot:g1700.t1